MRKIAVALAFVPVVSHADLIMVDPPRQHSNAPHITPAATGAAMKATVAASPPAVAVPAADSDNFVDVRQLAVAPVTAATGLQITPEPPPVPVWVAKVGSTARESIEQWAIHAGWKAAWRARMPDGRVINYNIAEADVSVKGPIEEAVGKFISLYDGARYPLKVGINTEQKLFVITLKH
ncbi:TcpQ domain-containing protein [Burkholderia vietnamiensis]|uniref:TcpQ domain-containing protein n=1 Tax=Burkholderia vietnamiensis TaxID=60552 RepID=UPI0015931D88|nr:TcpQ domain-containing protein [Burkholderia vietnamiensis]MCA8270701.1 TcpQ domain-containing protein [Burkholderia vietnamiensis]